MMDKDNNTYIHAYILVNEKEPSKWLFKSKHFHVTLHEYLSYLRDTSNNNICSSLQIWKVYLAENKKYPFIHNIYKLNKERQYLEHKFGTIFLPKIFPFNEIFQDTNNHNNNKNNSKIPSKKPVPTEEENFYKILDETKNMLNINDEVKVKVNCEDLLSELQKAKKIEEENVNNIKESYEKKIEEFSQSFNKLNNEKRQKNIQKHREEESKRIFQSDKDVYKKIRTNIKEGKFNEDKIPELFNKKYPIFKFMDENELLDKDDEYSLYLSFFEEIYPSKKKNNNESYIPHDINYRSKEEQDAYIRLECNQCSDEIEDFLYKKGTVPPLDEILKELDQTDSDSDT